MERNTKTGFGGVIILIVIGILALGGSALYVSQKNSVDSLGDAMMEEHNPKMDDNNMVEKSDDAMKMTDEGEKMIKDDSGDAMMKDDEEKMMMSYTGKILAGKSSPLIEYNKSDYDQALASSKLVVLFFYANWCPTCKAEIANSFFPAFNELTSDNVVGFRISYNDNETTADEKSLAKEYGVAYQHTKVFIKNGKRILKSPESWNKARYLTEINNALIY